MRKLPFETADGWLYTSAWDGRPTILIELGALGVPIVASADGGVPGLINGETGWPVAGDAGSQEYVRALREMIDNPKLENRQGAERSRHGCAKTTRCPPTRRNSLRPKEPVLVSPDISVIITAHREGVMLANSA